MLFFCKKTVSFLSLVTELQVDLDLCQIYGSLSFRITTSLATLDVSSDSYAHRASTCASLSKRGH
jgi:hypothetical protein